MSTPEERIKVARAAYARMLVDDGYLVYPKKRQEFEDALWKAAEALFAAVDERDALRKRVAQLDRDIIDTERDARIEIREAAAEAAWKARQDEDYGSF